MLGMLQLLPLLCAGYKPYKITHSSDYFQELYELAVQLIHSDLAYICHQQSDEIKGHNPPPSPWRNRPINESLQIFEVRRGKMEWGMGDAENGCDLRFVYYSTCTVKGLYKSRLNYVDSKQKLRNTLLENTYISPVL